MDQILRNIFGGLIFVLLIIGPLLGFYLLTRPDYFLERAFPKVRPKANLFFSKKTDDSDKVVLYYFARIFGGCLVALFVIVAWRFLLVLNKG